MPKAKKPEPKQHKTKSKDKKVLKWVLIGAGIFTLLVILGVVGMIMFIYGFSKTVKVDTNGNGTATVTTDDGSQTSSTFGNGVSLPDGFPADVPVYDPSTVIFITTSDNIDYSLDAKTSDSSDEVAKYYNNELPNQGWQKSSQSTFGDGIVLKYIKDNRTLTVSTSKPKKSSDNKTYITISVSTSKYQQ